MALFGFSKTDDTRPVLERFSTNQHWGVFMSSLMTVSCDTVIDNIDSEAQHCANSPWIMDFRSAAILVLGVLKKAAGGRRFE